MIRIIITALALLVFLCMPAQGFTQERSQKVTALDANTFVVVKEQLIPGTSSVELFRVVGDRIELVDIVFVKQDGMSASVRRLPVMSKDRGGDE